MDSGFDEGGRRLLSDAGADLPDEAKLQLSNFAVCVHPDTAVIYAVCWGRFTFVVRRPRGAPPAARHCETLDGWVDLAGLDDEWAFAWFDDGEGVQDLLDAHHAAGMLASR